MHTIVRLKGGCARPQPCHHTPITTARPFFTAHKHKLLRRAKCASSPQDDPSTDRDVRHLLERMYRASEGVDSAAPEPTPAKPVLIPNLPLWRVQWVVLPGYQCVLHIHVPHYVSMFEELLSRPRPWRFGHLYLPGGSANLSAPEYALAPGSQAALVGTLMEVLQAVRFPDGRLLVLAAGLGRFRVAQTLQTLPYSVADAAPLPDAEEVDAFATLAAHAAAAIHDRPEIAGQVAQAACAAAAAAAATWQQYEVSGHRVVDQLAVIDGADEAQAQAFGRRLLDISANEYLALPYWPASQAQWLHSHADIHDGAANSSAAGPMQQGSRSASGSVLVDEADIELQDAAVAAQCAAAVAVESWLQAAHESSLDSVEADAAEHAGDSAGHGYHSIAKDGISHTAVPQAEASEKMALELEGAIWDELATVYALLNKVNKRRRQLPDGLHCLQPPLGDGSSSDSDWEDGVDEGSGKGMHSALPPGGAHPAYPPLRRAQRLSFALANSLPTFGGQQAALQVLLEAKSTSSRLRLVLEGVHTLRNKLAALAALQGLAASDGSDRQ